METVEALIEQVRKGALVLPEFQRGYVWSTDQVRELVRSMYRGHPTGHLLVWKTYRPSPTRGAKRDGEGYSRLLLDGQQRLTSLYTLIEGQAPPFYEGERLFFNLYFNVLTEDFRFWQKLLMNGDPTWVPVADILKGGMAGVFARMASMPDDVSAIFKEPARLERLNRLAMLGKYTYQVDELVGDDLVVEEVVDIFNRVNSAGTPLKKHDLALAHICTIWPQARQELRDFAGRMRDERFSVDIGFLVRCVAGVAGDSVLLEGSFYRVPAEDLQLAWKKVRESFEHLVNVLKHEAFIDRIEDLPSPNVLLPLVVYLARSGAVFTDERRKRGFMRWMYFAALWTRYSTSTDTKLQYDIGLLQEDDPVEALIDVIRQDRGRLQLDARDVAGKGAGSPVYKLSYIVARARGATDWFSGLPLYSLAVGKANGLESHHIFPKALLNRELSRRGLSKYEQERTVNEVANRAFLTGKANRKIAATAPASYLPVVAADHPGALEAQAVPMDRELWNLEQVDAFLARRRQLLADAINDFIEQVAPRAGHNAAAVSVGELIARGEGAELEFKSSLRWDVRQQLVNKTLERVVAKSIAGFLNSSTGGTLLIGVADDGSVVGLEPDYNVIKRGDRDGFENQLTQVLVSNLGESAMAYVETSFHDLEGRDICQVNARPSDHPIYVFEAQTSTFYLRTGNATRPLPPHEFAKFVTSRWGGSK